MLKKIQLPTEQVILEPSGKKITYRAFTVKEQKILMLASNSDSKQVITSVLQVLSNCIIDDIDVETLAFYEVEFLLLKIRALSVSSIADIVLNGYQGNDCDLCKEDKRVKIDLNSIKLSVPDNFSDTIKFKDFSFKMKSISYHNINNLSKLPEQEQTTYIAGLIDSIIYPDDIIKTKDIELKEIIDFVESMPITDYAKIDEWFSSLPKLSHTINHTCPQCGHKQELKLEGLDNFLSI